MLVYSLLKLRLGSGGWDLEEIVELCLLDHDGYGICDVVVERLGNAIGWLYKFSS